MIRRNYARMRIKDSIALEEEVKEAYKNYVMPLQELLLKAKKAVIPMSDDEIELVGDALWKLEEELRYTASDAKEIARLYEI